MATDTELSAAEAQLRAEAATDTELTALAAQLRAEAATDTELAAEAAALRAEMATDTELTDGLATKAAAVHTHLLGDITDYDTPTAGLLPSGTQGDILYFDTDSWKVLAAGDAGKYLKTGGAATNPSWDTPSGLGDMLKSTYDKGDDGMVDTAQDLSLTSQAAGDVVYFDGTNWVRLGKDEGKFLKSGASAVSWDTPSGSGDMLKATYDTNDNGAVDTAENLSLSSQTAGDIAYFNGTQWVRLAKDVGKYLKSGDSSVSWDSPSGGSFDWKLSFSDWADTDLINSGTVYYSKSFYTNGNNLTTVLMLPSARTNPDSYVYEFEPEATLPFTSWWAMEDTAWTDSGTYTNDVKSTSGSPTVTTGAFGNGFNCVASDGDILEVPWPDCPETGWGWQNLNPQGQAGYSFAFAVKFTTLPSYPMGAMYVICFGTPGFLSASGASGMHAKIAYAAEEYPQFVITVGNVDFWVPGEVEDGVWYYVVVSHDQSPMNTSIYINNVKKVDSNTSVSLPDLSVFSVFVGGNGMTDYCDAVIDEFIIYTNTWGADACGAYYSNLYLRDTSPIKLRYWEYTNKQAFNQGANDTVDLTSDTKWRLVITESVDYDLCGYTFYLK
jgi:hypothetical protein